MKASRRTGRKVTKTKSEYETSSKMRSKFERSEELETDKESVISRYDSEYSRGLSDLSEYKGSKGQKSFSMNMSYSLRQSGGDESDSDEEGDGENEIEILTVEQRNIRDRWINLFHKLQKNVNNQNYQRSRKPFPLLNQRVKVDEAFDYELEEELKLVLYEWKDSGCILESMSKLYSYKVDSLTKSSYNLLAAIARGQQDVEQQTEEIQEQNKMRDSEKKQEIQSQSFQQINQTNSDKLVGFNELSAGQKQLERSEKLTVERYDLEFDVDPMFRKTSIIFDVTGSQILINSLKINSQLFLQLGEMVLKEVDEEEEQKGHNVQQITDNNDYFEVQPIQKSERNLLKNALTQSKQSEMLPELQDFKGVIIRETYLNQREEVGELEGIRILSKKSNKAQQEDIASSFLEDISDKQLWSEIEQAFDLSEDRPYHNLTQFTPSSQINRNKQFQSQNIQKQLRFEAHEDVERYEFSQDSHFGDDKSTDNISQQIDSSTLDDSFSKVGIGDNKLFNQQIIDWNWGDPKQWEDRDKKKIKKGKHVLDEIEENTEEDPNETRSNKQNSQQFRFTFDIKKREKKEDVFSKKQNKSKNIKQLKEAVVYHKVCHPKDCRIFSRQFEMSLVRENNKIDEKNKSEHLQNQFDIFHSTNSPSQSRAQQKTHGEYGFEDLLAKEEQLFERVDSYHNSYENNPFQDSLIENQERQFDNKENYSFYQYSQSPLIHSQPNFYSQVNSQSQFFSQTSRKRQVKIRDLKQSVWQCMTTSKVRDCEEFSLQPLSQFTATKSQNKQQTRKSDRGQKVSSSLKENVFFAEDSSALKFSELVSQLPEVIQGEEGPNQSVSIQNCFISLLHLANEKTLRLIDFSHSEQEFYIVQDDDQEQQINF